MSTPFVPGPAPTRLPTHASDPTDQTLAELVIDLDVIAANVQRLAAIAEPAGLMVVVKADGYNHGMIDVARAAVAAGARQLAVATMDEALRLRRDAPGLAAVPLTAWMWYPGQDIRPAIRAGITIGLPSLAHIEALLDLLEEDHADATTPHPAPATLMMDTGLSRSGIAPANWEPAVALLASERGRRLLDITGIMSHLASADDLDCPAVTDRQAARFAEAIALCRAHGLEVPTNHIANTPATLSRPDLRYELVRPGVGVYGIDPLLTAAEKKDLGLRTAMTLRARVITTRVVPAGEGVSYGLTWTASVDTHTAVVALGYADGLPRSLSNQLWVSINGRSYPQIGRVCMDQIVIDLGPTTNALTHAPIPAPVEPGDWATILGGEGPSTEELAREADTIAYEILTMPRGRIARRVLPVTAAHCDPHAPAGEVVVADAEQMRELGRMLGATLGAGTVVCLTGPLGAGKTTLTQGLAAGLGVRGRVHSPTFTLVHTHKPNPQGVGMLHLDAYRLLGAEVAEDVAPGESLDRDTVLDTLESLDVDADLDRDVLVAEWGRGVVDLLPGRLLDIEIFRDEPGADVTDVDLDAEPRRVRWTWIRR